MARNSNRIANGAELDTYIAEVTSLVRDPETARRIEARIRARAADFGVTLVNETGWNIAAGHDISSTDSTFVGRK